MFQRIIVWLIVVAPVTITQAQEWSIVRIDAPVQLDGIPDEAAWADIPVVPLTMYEPLFEGEPTERTEIKVAYDDEYLYVGGKLYDTDPDGVRANSLYRDRYSGDDVFAIILDTFNDNENALWFFTTPAGVRFDMAVSNDAEFSGGNPFGGVINPSWNTFWDAATQVTEAGWFAEMRIPFSSMGFQDEEGLATMGVIVYRYISRKNERHIYPPIPPNWGMGFAKPSQAEDIVLEGVYSQKPLYITPYALGGVGRTAMLNDGESAYVNDNAFTREIGLDVKYNVTSNLTLDLTVNTDFAQVEADDQQVNLTRFSLFFPEKRQFFQERAGIFNFQTGRLDRLFHSRRIGLSGGEQIPILGGTRLVGRVGRWDVGLIDMQTAKHEGLPSENFGVLRLRRQVVNENSYVGGITTSRINQDGAYNVAYGLDGIFRVGEQDYLSLQWAQSVEQELIEANTFDFLNTGLGRLRFERRGQQGFTFSTGLTRIGADYNPGMGFVTRRDVYNTFGRVAYGWFLGADSPFRRISPSLFASTYYRNDDGTIESVFSGLTWSFDMKSGDRMSAGVRYQVEDLEDAVSFAENTEVLEGRYEFTTFEGQYDMHDGRLLRTGIEMEGGTFYDGKRFSTTFMPSWNVSRFLELGADYELNIVRFDDRDEGFDAHIVRLRTQIGFNTRLSLNAFVQYSNVFDVVTTNLRFRYNFREGNDLWIVYNEGLNMDRERELPTLPVSDNRTLLLKYTYTFQR